MSHYKMISVEAEVLLEEFDDDEIEEEHEARFGNTKHDNVWHALYELRTTKPVNSFLSEIDKLIMDRTGRII